MKLGGWERWTLAVTGLCLVLMAARFRAAQRTLPLPEPLPPVPVVSRSVSGPRVNLNTANKQGLMTLPGIGEQRALDILRYRATHGPFQRVEDLLEISGIGPGVLEGLREYATVGGEGYG